MWPENHSQPLRPWTQDLSVVSYSFNRLPGFGERQRNPLSKPRGRQPWHCGQAFSIPITTPVTTEQRYGTNRTWTRATWFPGTMPVWIVITRQEKGESKRAIRTSMLFLRLWNWWSSCESHLSKWAKAGVNTVMRDASEVPVTGIFWTHSAIQYIICTIAILKINKNNTKLYAIVGAVPHVKYLNCQLGKRSVGSCILVFQWVRGYKKWQARHQLSFGHLDSRLSCRSSFRWEWILHCVLESEPATATASLFLPFERWPTVSGCQRRWL